MTSKSELKDVLLILLQGTNPRLGVDSPVQLLTELPSRLIGEFLCEEENLLLHMLSDYYYWSGDHPRDEGEIDGYLTEMRQIYLHTPSESSCARLEAYATGTQDDFMNQPAEHIICEACGTHCYYIGSLKYTPICSKCHEDDTVLHDITVSEIEPWIDIDTFYWVEYDAPDPETYADACAMYGYGSP
jgi:hypothetical protein